MNRQQLQSLAERIYGARKTADPVPSHHPPIKYVFYVIKENRTYNQVLGDMPEGHGSPDLILFGKDVTPNHHALAREYVLFDNFYVNGDVSADGHLWSTAGTSTEYVNKIWPTEYSGRAATAFDASYDGDAAHDAPVADNNLALGRVVERIARSRFWPESAIFVLETTPRGPIMWIRICQ